MDYVSVLMMDIVLVLIIWLNYIIVISTMSKNKNWLKDNFNNYTIGYLVVVLIVFVLHYFYETFA